MPSNRRKRKRKSARAPRKLRKKQTTRPKKRGRGPTEASKGKARSARIMSVAADQQLGADQVAQILADCLREAGGENNAIVVTKTLQSYGFHFQNQVDNLTAVIIGNADFGVRKYGFRLSGDALNFATPSTTLSDVADAIQDKATPAP